MTIKINECLYDIESFGSVSVNNDPDVINIDGEVYDLGDVTMVVDECDPISITDRQCDEDGFFVDFKVKYGKGTITARAQVRGKNYCYKGSYYEPSESSFTCTDVEIQCASYSDDDVDDIEVEFDEALERSMACEFDEEYFY